MQLEAIDHIVLRVRALDVSLSFYEQLLGLPIVGREEFASGQRPFVSARVGSALIDIWPDADFDRAMSQKHSGFFHFCMRVDADLEAEVLPRLRAAGVEVLEDGPAVRFGATGYGKSIYVRDPDGYMVELKETKTSESPS